MPSSPAKSGGHWRALLRRGGVALFAFYLIKGLLWLTVPYLIGQGLFGCGGE